MKFWVELKRSGGEIILDRGDSVLGRLCFGVDCLFLEDYVLDKAWCRNIGIHSQFPVPPSWTLYILVWEKLLYWETVFHSQPENLPLLLYLIWLSIFVWFQCIFLNFVQMTSSSCIVLHFKLQFYCYNYIVMYYKWVILYCSCIESCYSRLLMTILLRLSFTLT